jgi:hypothetical protein
MLFGVQLEADVTLGWMLTADAEAKGLSNFAQTSPRPRD